MSRTPAHLVRVAIALLGILPRVAAQEVPERRIPEYGVMERSIAELQLAMESGLTTSVEITEAYLERIRAYDQDGPRLNALLRINPNALEEAAAADRERAGGVVRGPLHGIPVVVKDNFDVEGMPTSAASLALAGVIPSDDAFQVRRLREGGAVILGKTNMSELAMGITTRASLGGQTLNPYDLDRNPGGSSGGTAVAVAASFAAVGWGTDACGSIRVPASQNNVIGLRPTWGLASMDGILSVSRTHDVTGVIARTARDLAFALDATIGPDPADPATRVLQGRPLPQFVRALDEGTLAGVRIGVAEYYFGDSFGGTGGTAEVVRAALDRMALLGATLVPVDVTGLLPLVGQAIVMEDEFKWDLADYLAGVPGSPVRSLDDILTLGLVDERIVPVLEILNRSTSRATIGYMTALLRREELIEMLADLMEGARLDVLAYPTLQALPAYIEDAQVGSNCALASNSGYPAISFPAGFTEGGLPVGIEFLGRPFEDARLVAMAHAFEQASSHRTPPPSTPALTAGRAPEPVAFEVRVTGEGMTPAVPSAARADVRFRWDPVLGVLEYEFEISGVAEQDSYGLALRAPNREGKWVVMENLAGPSELSGRGSLQPAAPLRRLLEGGGLVLDLFTARFPLGAARAPVSPW